MNKEMIQIQERGHVILIQSRYLQKSIPGWTNHYKVWSQANGEILGHLQVQGMVWILIWSRVWIQTMNWWVMFKKCHTTMQKLWSIGKKKLLQCYHNRLQGLLVLFECPWDLTIISMFSGPYWAYEPKNWNKLSCDLGFVT